jgi:hypothetical protein
VNFALEVFSAKLGFMQRTCRRSGQITAAQIIGAPCGVALLGQQDFATGAVLNILKNVKVFLQ